MNRSAHKWLGRWLGMNADALFERGREAWLPCEPASNLKVLHVTDVPTVGVFNAEGTSFLFRCLSGHLERASLWAYRALDSSEASRVSAISFHDVEELAIWLDARFTSVGVWFATAVDDEIDCWSEPIDVSDDLLTQAVGFLENMARAHEATPARARRLEQARLDAELRELGSAIA